MRYSADIESIIGDVSEYLHETWGIDSEFGRNIAIFLIYLQAYRISFTITSGFRSPEKQAELSRRYAAGDPSVIVPPAKNSLHSKKTWLGGPAALAIDIQTSNPTAAAAIADALDIGAGIYFSPPDPVHYYKKGV